MVLHPQQWVFERWMLEVGSATLPRQVSSEQAVTAFPYSPYLALSYDTIAYSTTSSGPYDALREAGCLENLRFRIVPGLEPRKALNEYGGLRPAEIK